MAPYSSLWLLEETPKPTASSIILPGPAQKFLNKIQKCYLQDKNASEKRMLISVTLTNLNSPQLASGRNSLVFLQLDIVTFLKKVEVDEMINFIIHT